jgi:hypothetical protein
LGQLLVGGDNGCNQCRIVYIETASLQRIVDLPRPYGREEVRNIPMKQSRMRLVASDGEQHTTPTSAE